METLTYKADTGNLANAIAAVVSELVGSASVYERSHIRQRLLSHAPLSGLGQLDSAVDIVLTRLYGLGDIEILFQDSDVTEVMINGPGVVWVERNGCLEPSAVTLNRSDLELLVERVVAPLGRRVDRASPQVDARLPDGSRVHIAVAPIALDGPYITIRRFNKASISLYDFASADVCDLLVNAVHDRKNLVISGGTGSGKTTLLNALATLAGATERIVTIEDNAELNIDADHVLRLECQLGAESAGAESRPGSFTLAQLVKASLRMRPDRIIVGEVRGAEAFDMVQALLTGHRGSMSSCHAQCPEQALDRLETLMLLARHPIDSAVAARQLYRAIDLVVHVKRSGSARYIDSVLEIGQDSAKRWLVRGGELI